MLVAPVVEKGAASRQVYLPRGVWYDFWNGERMEGGREITRKVDLETMPLYVRAGTILPLGPVKQYTGEAVDGPLTLQIYPGAPGQFLVYEDDGVSFSHRQGDWMGLDLHWDDRARRLSIEVAEGSRMRPPLERKLEVKIMPDGPTRPAVFTGKKLDLSL